MRAASGMRPEGVRKDEVWMPNGSALAEYVAVRQAGEPTLSHSWRMRASFSTATRCFSRGMLWMFCSFH